MTEQKKIIESILGDYNGNPAMVGKFQRSLATIAVKIYAETTHFIFELIQNADDNSYRPDDVASLSLSILEIELNGTLQKCLLVGNNETGFQENQVRAICDVDASTKKHDASSIGEKGIGFKSVFAVTDCPYIFSNGYQFCLPKETEVCGTQLGYVVPQWVDIVPVDCKETTNILLPIKDEQTLGMIVEELKALSPETILFLRKLHRITISVDLEDDTYLNEIIREEQAKTPIVDLTCLENQDGTIVEHKSSYLYHSLELTKPESVLEASRTGIQTRTLTIAIPLTANDNDGGKLFAYLPVYLGTGFPFIINADFVLTSARDNLCDNAWNRWLCNAIPNFYADIVEQAMNSPVLTQEQKLAVFSRIPVLTNDHHFTEIIGQIHADLRHRKILQAFQSSRMVAPEECQLLGQDKRKILETLEWTPEYMGEEAGKYLFCSAELSRFTGVLAKLGVKDNQNSILPCFTEKLLSKTDNPKLLELYRYLIRAKVDVGDAALIPVWTEHKRSFVSGSNEAVFWHKPEEPFPVFPQMDVFFVLKSFYDYMHSVYEDKEKVDELKKQMQGLLHIKDFTLGVYSAQLKHILTPGFSGKPDDFIEISHFLLENDIYPEYFVTNRGIAKAEEQSKYIVVSGDFDPECGWQKIWQEAREREHFAYLVGYSTEDQQKLLQKGCIRKYPFFQLEITWNSRHPAITEDCRNDAANQNDWHRSRTYFECPAIPRSLLNREPDAIRAYVSFWSIVSSWRMYSNEYNYRLLGLAVIRRCGGAYSRDIYESTLKTLVKTTAWVKTSLGLRRPGEVWAYNENIRRVLGEGMPYLQMKIAGNIAKEIGIHTELTVMDILAILKSYSSANKVIAVEHAINLYKQIRNYFDTNPENHHILDDSDKYIFMPDSEQHWYSPDECYWKESKIFGSEYQYLERYYPDELRSFFCGKIGIRQEVSLETYLDYWLKAQGQGRTISADAVADLYRKAYEYYKTTESSEAWLNFSRKAKLLTPEGQFVDRRYCLVNDMPFLQAKFADASEIAWHFEIEGCILAEQKDFYRQFGVVCLSDPDVITCSPKIAQVDDVEDATDSYLTPACVAMIATWICEQKGRDCYNRVLPLLSKLRDTRIDDIGESISVSYTLKIADKNIVRAGTVCAYWDIDANIIYADCDDDDFEYQLSACLADNILPESEHPDFTNQIRLYLKAKNIREIERKNWSVPEEFRDLVGKERRVSQKNAPVALAEARTSRQQEDAEPAEENAPEIEESASGNERVFAVEQVNFEDKLNDAFPLTRGMDDTYVEDDDEYAPDTPSPEVLARRSTRHLERLEQQAVHSVTVSREATDDGACPLEHFKFSENLNHKSRKVLRELWDKLREAGQLVICQPVKPEVRIFLEEQYHGKCQICGKTFRKRDGHPHFVATYLVKRDNGGKSDAGNAICLCAEHFAQWQYASLGRDKDFSELIADAERNGQTDIPLKLAGEDVTLHYNERHFSDLKDLLKASGNSGEQE